MDLLNQEEVDSLGSLEERIRQAIELVARLRREKEAAQAERDAALEGAASAQRQLSVLNEELETLRAERRQVRNRIEKLLGQIESLGPI